MKIVVLTLGTRGDVQPFMALALGLKKAGHDVMLAAGADFETFVADYGLNFIPIRARYQELFQSDEGRAGLAGDDLKSLNIRRRNIIRMMGNILDDSWKASQGAEAIIFHPRVMAGPHIAEKLDIPAFAAMPTPMLTPTRAFSCPGVPFPRFGKVFNRLSFAGVRFWNLFFRKPVNRWRRDVLGLPPLRGLADDMTIRGSPVPVLYCYSPHVVPRPPDWPAHVVVTGYWFLERHDSWQPSPELLEFLEAGQPPVCVGFGSMVSRRPERLTRIVVEALSKSRQRGILATGWGGLTDVNLPDSVFGIDSAPYDWLFPRMKALVHHAGFGTVGAGLRAGKPTIGCPFYSDQPFWARIVYELGVGPKPIPQKKLSAEGLARAIEEAASNKAMQQRASKLGETIRAEDGIARAVEAVDAFLGRP